jgi:2-aminoadipate transaminase
VPEGLDSKAMLPRAVTQRVAYVPGTAFYADTAAGAGSRQLRLSFCYPTPERIREGVRRLATVLEGELDLVATFGTGSPRTGTGSQSPSPDTA